MDKNEKHPVDRRVRKTRKLLRQGLIKLLMEKDINDISINELVTLIDINRGTFYLHCKDLHDLSSQIQDEVVEEITAILNTYSAEDMKNEDLPFFIDLLKFIQENSDLFLLLMVKNSNSSFSNKLMRLLQDNCFDHFKTIYQKDNPYAYAVFATFSVSGCIGVIQLWLETGHQESIEFVAKTLSILVDKGMGYLSLADSIT